MFFPFIVNLQYAPSWLEIVEAAGVIGAFIAVAVSLTELLKKDKDRQKQIDSLAALAEEAKAQTEIMEESNQTQTDFFVQITKLVASNEENAEIQRQEVEANKKQRKIAIKPRITPAGGTSSSKSGAFAFKNNGGRCKVVDCKRGDQIKVAIPGLEKLIGKYLEPGVKNEIVWRLKVRNTEPGAFDINLGITLEDVDENRYLLTITGSARRPIYSELVAITEES